MLSSSTELTCSLYAISESGLDKTVKNASVPFSLRRAHRRKNTELSFNASSEESGVSWTATVEIRRDHIQEAAGFFIQKEVQPGPDLRRKMRGLTQSCGGTYTIPASVSPSLQLLLSVLFNTEIPLGEEYRDIAEKTEDLPLLCLGEGLKQKIYTVHAVRQAQGHLFEEHLCYGTEKTVVFGRDKHLVDVILAADSKQSSTSSVAAAVASRKHFSIKVMPMICTFEAILSDVSSSCSANCASIEAVLCMRLARVEIKDEGSTNGTGICGACLTRPPNSIPAVIYVICGGNSKFVSCEDNATFPASCVQQAITPKTMSTFLKTCHRTGVSQPSNSISGAIVLTEASWIPLHLGSLGGFAANEIISPISNIKATLGLCLTSRAPQIEVLTISQPVYTHQPCLQRLTECATSEFGSCLDSARPSDVAQSGERSSAVLPDFTSLRSTGLHTETDTDDAPAVVSRRKNRTTGTSKLASLNAVCALTPLIRKNSLVYTEGCVLPSREISDVNNKAVPGGSLKSSNRHAVVAAAKNSEYYRLKNEITPRDMHRGGMNSAKSVHAAEGVAHNSGTDEDAILDDDFDLEAVVCTQSEFTRCSGKFGSGRLLKRTRGSNNFELDSSERQARFTVFTPDEEQLGSARKKKTIRGKRLA